jgi:hypothetical protein
VIAKLRVVEGSRKFIVNAELIESTLKQTIMCLCFDDFFYGSRNIKNGGAYNMYCSLHLISSYKKNTDNNSSLQK